MEEQWAVFVSCTKAKAESHQKVARFWSRIDTSFGLALILVSALTTAAALLTFVPSEVVAGFGAISTVLAATVSFLRPADKRNIHDKACRDFRSLMVQMISCETEAEYERLWNEFNREIMEEPLVPKRYAASTDIKLVMSSELRQVIVEKDSASNANEGESNRKEPLAKVSRRDVGTAQNEGPISKEMKSPIETDAKNTTLELQAPLLNGLTKD